MVRRSFPAVRLFALDENLGFAGGINLALNSTNAGYVLILNPDVVMTASGLAAMLSFLERTPRRRRRRSAAGRHGRQAPYTSVPTLSECCAAPAVLDGGRFDFTASSAAATKLRRVRAPRCRPGRGRSAPRRGDASACFGAGTKLASGTRTTSFGSKTWIGVTAPGRRDTSSTSSPKHAQVTKEARASVRGVCRSGFPVLPGLLPIPLQASSRTAAAGGATRAHCRSLPSRGGSSNRRSPHGAEIAGIRSLGPHGRRSEMWSSAIGRESSCGSQTPTQTLRIAQAKLLGARELRIADIICRDCVFEAAAVGGSVQPL